MEMDDEKQVLNSIEMRWMMAEYTREDKIEAIQAICQYDRKLADAMDILAEEMETGVSDMESEVFGQVVQGLNWTIEVLQQVMDVINEKEKKLEKEVVNDALIAFDQACKAEDEDEIISVLRSKLAPAVRSICEVGEQF